MHRNPSGDSAPGGRHHGSLSCTRSRVPRSTAAQVDGKDALEKLDGGTFDVVVTDLAMPNVDGWELTRRIKAESPEVVVIVMSAHVSMLGSERARAAGADAVCGKPCLPADVVGLVKKHAPRRPPC